MPCMHLLVVNKLPPDQYVISRPISAEDSAEQRKHRQQLKHAREHDCLVDANVN